MIAARFRLIAWVAGCAFAALLCYMASQSVAAERGTLARIDAQIADTQNDIDRLTTEIAARSRPGQLDRWNQTFSLQAARPVQYVASEVQLASYTGGRKLPLDPAIANQSPVQMASYEKPAAPAAPPQPAQAPAPVAQQAPAPVAQQPMLREATYVQPKPSRLADDTPAPVVKASLEKPIAKIAAPKAEPPKPAKLTLASFEVPAPARKAVVADDPAPAKPRRKAAKIDDGLLPSDLGSLIAAEKKGGHKKAAL